MADVTLLLDRWAHGDSDAFRALVPLVYEELRTLAGHYLRRERGGHTLQPTALVHEAYLRLSGMREVQLRNRSHFYGAAAQVMRRILVDHARRRRADKRGGEAREPISLEDLIDVPADMRVDLAALDEALQAFERVAPEKARVVELRYFGGLSVEETAEYLGLGPATVKRYWAFARAWLFRYMDLDARDPLTDHADTAGTDGPSRRSRT